eukprot:COSAG05_NODE_830_length_7099_cov_10.124000_4_plen_793_part_00
MPLSRIVNPTNTDTLVSLARGRYRGPIPPRGTVELREWAGRWEVLVWEGAETRRTSSHSKHSDALHAARQTALIEVGPHGLDSGADPESEAAVEPGDSFAQYKRLVAEREAVPTAPKDVAIVQARRSRQDPTVELKKMWKEQLMRCDEVLLERVAEDVFGVAPKDVLAQTPDELFVGRVPHLVELIMAADLAIRQGYQQKSLIDDLLGYSRIHPHTDAREDKYDHAETEEQWSPVDYYNLNEPLATPIEKSSVTEAAERRQNEMVKFFERREQEQLEEAQRKAEELVLHEQTALKLQAWRRGKLGRQIVSEKQAQIEARRKKLHAVGVRMGLRIRLVGMHKFIEEFAKFNTDGDGIINALECRAYLRDVGEWGWDRLFTDELWEESFPTVCQQLGCTTMYPKPANDAIIQRAALAIQKVSRSRQARKLVAQLRSARQLEKLGFKETAKLSAEQRRKKLHGLGLRMGLRMRMVGKEAFATEFMQHDADHNGVINAEEFKSYLRAVGEWDRDELYSDAHWADSWPTVCGLLGVANHGDGIPLELFDDYVGMNTVGSLANICQKRTIEKASGDIVDIIQDDLAKLALSDAKAAAVRVERKLQDAKSTPDPLPLDGGADDIEYQWGIPLRIFDNYDSAFFQEFVLQKEAAERARIKSFERAALVGQAAHRGRQARIFVQGLRDEERSKNELEMQKIATRRKKLHGLGLRMGLRMRMVGKEAFATEFMQHDADHNGVINAEEFKSYLRAVDEWDKDELYSDAHWADSWPTVCGLLGVANHGDGIPLELFDDYVGMNA